MKIPAERNLVLIAVTAMVATTLSALFLYGPLMLQEIFKVFADLIGAPR